MSFSTIHGKGFRTKTDNQRIGTWPIVPVLPQNMEITLRSQVSAYYIIKYGKAFFQVKLQYNNDA